MASGSTVTLSGGTTMTQVVTGDTIDDADFNNARANVDRLLGNSQDVTLGTFTASSTYGWGQGGAGVNTVSAGTPVYASSASVGFKDLQDDVQAMCAFLGVSLRTGVGSDVSTSTTITASTWSNLMLNIKDCWDSRFSAASTPMATDASKTYTSAWTNSLSQETAWTFANENDCRRFFNGGGRLGFSASYSGSSGAQYNSWVSALSNMGNFWLMHNTSGSGAGAITGIGFYELSTGYQNLMTGSVGTTPYSGDTIVVQGRVNSTTNPTVVYLKIILTDASDNVIDQSSTGTLSINANRSTPAANGSGFSFASPSDSMGNITGS
jgi:hypothetical protein